MNIVLDELRKCCQNDSFGPPAMDFLKTEEAHGQLHHSGAREPKGLLLRPSSQEPFLEALLLQVEKLYFVAEFLQLSAPAALD